MKRNILLVNIIKRNNNGGKIRNKAMIKPIKPMKAANLVNILRDRPVLD